MNTDEAVMVIIVVFGILYVMDDLGQRWINKK